MKRRTRCKVCGKRLNFDKTKRYEINKSPVVSKVYEAFDCERCGCQNIVNIREV